jgi:hypothetical protein
MTWTSWTNTQQSLVTWGPGKTGSGQTPGRLPRSPSHPPPLQLQHLQRLQQQQQKLRPQANQQRPQLPHNHLHQNVSCVLHYKTAMCVCYYACARARTCCAVPKRVSTTPTANLNVLVQKLII